MTRRPKTSPPSKSVPSEDLRERVLADFAALKIPLREAAFDAVVAQAEREGLSHLAFLQRLISEQAQQRRERSIAYRVRDARFREAKTLATFDWLFNAKAIDRSRVEALATGEFIRRRENLVLLGQSGVGKSRLAQAIGQQACVAGLARALHDERGIDAGSQGVAGRSDPATPAALLGGLRSGDPG